MSVIELYEKLSSAPDDKTRARIIAEAFETLEERYPRLSDVATRQDLSEAELRLIKEIEQVRSELKETELNLQKEIEQVRANLRLEIKAVEVRLTQAIHRQTLWVIGSVGAIITLIRLMEWFLEHLPN